MSRTLIRVLAGFVPLLAVAILAVRVLAAGGETSAIGLQDLTAPECFNPCWSGIEVIRSNVKQALDVLDTGGVPHSDYDSRMDSIIRIWPTPPAVSDEVVMYVHMRFQAVVRFAFTEQACPLGLLTELGPPDKIDAVGRTAYLIYGEGVMVGVLPPSHERRFQVELIPREQASAIIAIQDVPPRRAPTWDDVRGVVAEACI